MAKNFTQLTVFVSSPGGIEEDRSAVQSAVDESNKILQSEQISLSTYLWERDVVPGKADIYSQEIINRKIDEDTDIFILLMHSRVGTATPKSTSGTIEEFERIHSAVESGSRRAEICIYFSVAPISPLTDASQLYLVQDFRRRVQSLAYLTRDYDAATDLRTILISHLIEKARKIASFPGGGELSANSSNAQTVIGRLVLDPYGEDDDEDDSLGPLDYENVALENLTTAAKSITEVGDLVSEYSLVMGQDKLNLERMAENSSKGIHVNRIVVIDRFCDHLNDHLNKIEPVVSILEDAFSGAASATLSLVQEWPIPNDEAKSTFSEFLNVVETTTLNLKILQEATSEIPIFFEQWPGLTKNLKISKRRGKRLYQRLNDGLKRNLQTLAAAVEAGRERL